MTTAAAAVAVQRRGLLLPAVPSLLLLLLLLLGGASCSSVRPRGGEPRREHQPNRALDALAAALRDVGGREASIKTSNVTRLDLVFLIDASASVGETNFRGELSFVRKLLHYFETESTSTQVAIVTFAGRGQIVRHVDYISNAAEKKCQSLNKHLKNVTYIGGGTYTYGALMEALEIFKNSEAVARKVVFLVTDGFSNGNDPRLAANLLKGSGVTIFTFGIQTGNVDELRDIASEPSCAYSYFLNNFMEFESLARKALHKDLKAVSYTLAGDPRDCGVLCNRSSSLSTPGGCCDTLATCSCSAASENYACKCPPGYMGTGLGPNSCQPCPNGTYGFQNNPNDHLSGSCIPCPDANHVTHKIPATSMRDCICTSGFTNDRAGSCEAVKCPKLIVPKHGYFVKGNDCSNVVNAACGIRCSIGFHLTGDSIRLCSKNGSWSGDDTHCLLKTCAALRAPANGRIKCELENEIDRSKINNDKAVQPIDTRCQFKCESGFQLRGSKVRNCLPLARWDGLKATCKPIHCEPLKAIVNGEVHPKNCMGPKKLPYGTNCTMHCKKGYKLEGPRARSCTGRHGTWSKRQVINRCIDKMRPVLTCPENINVTALPGKNHAFVNWSLPNVTDNSGVECSVWSKPVVTFPWKVRIGKHTVRYIAQDISGNKARCSFHIFVIDKEPPKMENCENNHILLSGSEKNLQDIFWDEPVFHDNSGLSVKVNKTFHSTSKHITGQHSVSFDIADKYENTANCNLNLTVEDPCDDIPKPSNARAECIIIENGVKQCNLLCDHGYAFALVESDSKLQNNQFVVMCNPFNRTWSPTTFTDCSPVKVPDTVSHQETIIFEGISIDCGNTTFLDNITRFMNKSFNFNVIGLCENELECTVKKEIDCQTLYLDRRKRNIFDDTSGNITEVRHDIIRVDRKHRSPKLENLVKKEQIEIKFTLLAKIIEENENNTRVGIIKLKNKIQSMSKSGELNLLDEETAKGIRKLGLNLHRIFKDPLEICELGSVLKKNGCLKCPPATFHNITKGQCQSCSIGEYQNKLGTTKCEKCPHNFYTRRTHARSANECIAACNPGHYSRRKQHPELTVSLVPCVSCEIGFYQPHYGQSQCLPCPRNTITEGRAATSAADCLPANAKAQIDHLCKTKQPCLNLGTCNREKDGFSCECREHYVGSLCEKFVNPCLSSPCSSAGQCILRNSSDNHVSYFCSCKPGYTGKYCETLINECSYSPCRNGGTCLNTDTDFICACKNGFEGDFCEIAVNHCTPSPCEMNSTCRSVNGSWKCFCQPGYLGLRCNLVPCDWLPCHPNEICVNLIKENTDKNDYGCECPPGYSGRGCFNKVDHCQNRPCQNNGTCINNLLNYTCNCRIPFTGSNCENELFSNYVMHFEKSGTTEYVIMPGPLKNLTELTVCFWLQSNDTFNYGTVVSYATFDQDNAFTVTDYNGFVLYVNGENVISDVKVNDGHWHFICVCWENKLGSWKFYVDGVLKDNGTLLAKNTEIQAEGIFVFGQEQDEFGGGFSNSESLVGKLTQLDIWDKLIDPDRIKVLGKNCKKYYGSLIAWGQMQEHVRGNIQVLQSSFCQGCITPVNPFKGFVNMTDDGSIAIYSCENGYEFRKNNEHFKILNKKCLKHGIWEGSQIPNCFRISCPVPGHFSRGQILGRSYLFGDKITYQCNEGYDLKGNVQRVCKSDGKWSGGTPICIGITCKNLLAPDNGDIEYIIPENDRDDLSILQVGHKIEFKCDSGYFLSGQRILTCLKNGTWDYPRPKCITMGCQPPKSIHNGRIVVNASFTDSSKNQPSEALSYFYGDEVSFSCDLGYKFEGNHNLLLEFKLQCSASGEWTGLVPDCVPLRCPRPALPENSAAYLITMDHQELNKSEEEIFEEQMPDIENSFDTYSLINNSTIESSDELFSPGTRIKIICNNGYESISNSTIHVCTKNEVWTGESMRCEPKKCSIKNNTILKVFFGEGTNHEKEVSDQSKISEKNDTDFTEKLLQTFDFHHEGSFYGDKITLQCRNNLSNFQLIWRCDNDREWKLLNGNQSIDELISMIYSEDYQNPCKLQNCTLPKAPNNGYVEYENTTKTLNKILQSWKNITFKCDQGYRLVGAEKSYCLNNNGTWSSNPSCEPVTCEKPLDLPYAELKNENETSSFTFESTIFYQCLPGYRISGQLASRCLANGKWSNVDGKCLKVSCGKPKLVKGASIQGNSFLYQDRLVYICPGGKFRDLITCNENGKWSNLPHCA